MAGSGRGGRMSAGEKALLAAAERSADRTPIDMAARSETQNVASDIEIIGSAFGDHKVVTASRIGALHRQGVNDPYFSFAQSHVCPTGRWLDSPPLRVPRARWGVRIARRRFFAGVEAQVTPTHRPDPGGLVFVQK